jgi:hypothetical protein
MLGEERGLVVGSIEEDEEVRFREGGLSSLGVGFWICWVGVAGSGILVVDWFSCRHSAFSSSITFLVTNTTSRHKAPFFPHFPIKFITYISSHLVIFLRQLARSNQVRSQACLYPYRGRRYLKGCEDFCTGSAT